MHYLTKAGVKFLNEDTTETKGDRLQRIAREHFELIVKGKKNLEAAKALRAQYRQNENKVGDFFRRIGILQKKENWSPERRKRASDRAVKQAHKKAARDKTNAMMAQTDTQNPETIKNDAERAQFDKSMGDS
tara:strand:- start:439 stop:834 length:396 start_codon:yes stop_codon:yes gene_type:complete